MIANRLATTLALLGALTFGATARCEDSAKPTERQADGMVSVAPGRVLDYPVLWDQECLFNYQFFGLRFGTDKDHMTKFFYGRC